MNLNRIKKVVVAYGDKGTGKTTALCMLCESLISKCASGQFILQKKGNNKRLAAVPMNSKGAYQDVLCAVHCKGNADKKKIMIGVGTAGDNWESIEQAFMFFDSVFPEDEYAYVFIAIRRQLREDGLGVVEKSFPLMALERMERGGQLNVIRPFEKSSNTTKLSKGATPTQIRTFGTNCQRLATNLEKMI